jgi:hypothetical protein
MYQKVLANQHHHMHKFQSVAGYAGWGSAWPRFRAQGPEPAAIGCAYILALS